MSLDKQHVMGAAAEASEPALVSDQAPAGLDPTGFDQAQVTQADRDRALALWKFMLDQGPIIDEAEGAVIGRGMLQAFAQHRLASSRQEERLSSTKAATERRPIALGEGRYSVTEDGDVFVGDRLMKRQAGTKGYLRVGLTHNGKTVSRSIASLVAEAFIGPRPTGLQIAHIDGDKLNNHFSNLRYCTQLENEMDKRRHGTTARGEKHGSSKLSWDAVNEMRRLHAEDPKKYSYSALGTIFGVTKVTARHAVQGLSWAFENEVQTLRQALERLVSVADLAADTVNTSLMDEAIQQARAALEPPHAKDAADV